ncbi:hypothetical protein [Natrinema sp. SYSU A 869]|nr:hypothetical protein [Natrinema sp. SYSU A 869]
MTAHQQLVVQPYRCPDCEGALTFEERSWQCLDCGHVPRHAAD